MAAFVVQANQLDVLKASYQDIANHLRKIKEVVAVRAHAQNSLEDELRSAEKDYNDIRQITVEKQKLKEMIMERQWVRYVAEGATHRHRRTSPPLPSSPLPRGREGSHCPPPAKK